MKKLFPLLLVPVALIGIAATYTITQLTANLNPGNSTLIEVYDPAATPKSGKVLLTNYVRQSQIDTSAKVQAILGQVYQATNATLTDLSGATPTINGDLNVTGTITNGTTQTDTLYLSSLTETNKLLGLGATTNAMLATASMITNTWGIFDGTTTKFVAGDGTLQTPAGAALENTVLNSGASTANAVPTYSDVTGTNIAPSLVTVTALTNLTAPGVVTGYRGLFATSNSSDGVVIRAIYDGNTVGAGVNPRGIINDSVDNTPHGVHWSTYKARGTRDSKAIVQTSDFTGGMVNYAWDGDQYLPIQAFASFTRGTMANNSIPSVGYISATDTSGVLNYALIVTGDSVGIGFGPTSSTDPATLVPDTTLHVRGNSSFIQNDNYSGDTASAAFIGRKARGSKTSPGAVLAHDNLVGLMGRGYHSGGAFGTVNVGLWSIVAAENFTSSAQGTYMTWGTTPTGSTTRSERMRLMSTGYLAIGHTNATSTLHVAGSLAHSIATGAAFTLVATNNVYLVNDDADTVTLPTAVGIQGRVYTVKAITPCGSATVATTSSQLIDGASTYSLSASNKFVTVISDNANWWIIGNN